MQTSILAGNACINSFTALINAANTAGYIGFFIGTMPANTETANNGTMASQNFFANTSFPTTNTNLSNTTNIGSNTNIAANGTVSYYRFFDGVNTCIAQGSVATANADIIVNSTSFVAGGTFTMSYFTLTTTGAN